MNKIKIEDMDYCKTCKLVNMYNELIDINNKHQKINVELREENKQLKDNWNKLKKWIGNKDNNGFEKLYVEDIQIEMHDLESGDSNENNNNL